MCCLLFVVGLCFVCVLCVVCCLFFAAGRARSPHGFFMTSTVQLITCAVYLLTCTTVCGDMYGSFDDTIIVYGSVADMYGVFDDMYGRV